MKTVGPEDEFHYRHFAASANEIEALFKWHDVSISPNSYLAGILRAARHLAVIADVPHDTTVDAKVLYDAHCCARLAKSVLFLGYDKQYTQKFRDLYQGDLNFWVPARSKAKDTEWEIFLWRHLNLCIPGSTELKEPDLVLTLPSRKFGIACKRVYSLKNIMHQIDCAVRQMSRRQMAGLVALSLCPFPEDKENYNIPRVASAEELNVAVQRYFADVWKLIGPETIRKYLRPYRLLGLIISVHHFVQIGDAPHRIVDAAAMRFQTYNDPPIAKELMDLLYAAGFEQAAISDEVLLARLGELEAARRAA